MVELIWKELKQESSRNLGRPMPPVEISGMSMPQVEIREEDCKICFSAAKERVKSVQKG